MTPPGATLELPSRPAEPSGPSAGRPWRPPFAAGARDDWPRTNRWIPWLLAAFLVMLWLIPFDSTAARFDAPFDPKLDRLMISVMALAWIASVLAGGRLAPRWHRTALDWAVLVFVGVAIASVLLNIGSLVPLNEHELALKKLSLLFSYATFFFIVATTIRPSEIARFVKLFCVLAFITASGVIYQKHLGGGNLFFSWWNALVPDALLEVQGAPGANRYAGTPIAGPARHPLALALMMAVAMPFMAVGVLQARERRARILYTIGFTVLLAAVFATSRKTGSYATIAAMATLVAIRPRDMARLIPHGLVVFVALLLLFPRAVEYQLQQINPNRIAEGASGEHRKNDYVAVAPDVRAHPETGRGYGTYDPQEYRILDNNYLGLLLETGFLGIGAFVFMLGALVMVAWRPARSNDPARAGPAFAAAGGAIGFGVGMALFDALAYAQGPYLFFFIGAIAVVAGAPEVRERMTWGGAARRDEAFTEILPPLEQELAGGPPPALADDAEQEPAPPAVRERERQRQEREHAGRRARRRERLPARRRRAQPIREHVSGPLPGAPEPESEPEPKRPRRRPGRRAAAGVVALGGSARRAGGTGLRATRKRAGTILVGIAALAIGAFAFGGGGAPAPEDDGPRLGTSGGEAGDDPFGLGEFEEGGAASEREARRPRRRSQPRSTGGPTPARQAPATGGAPVPDDLGGDDLGGPPPARERDRGGERESEPRQERRPRRPRQPAPPPADPNPGGETPREDPGNDGGQPRDDCAVPPEVAELLDGIQLDPCAQGAGATSQHVQQAVVAGHLTAAQAARIVESLRAARRAG